MIGGIVAAALLGLGFGVFVYYAVTARRKGLKLDATDRPMIGATWMPGRPPEGR